MNFNIILNDINDIKLRKQKLFDDFQEDLQENYELLDENHNYLKWGGKTTFKKGVDCVRRLLQLRLLTKAQFLEQMFALFLKNVDSDDVTGLSILVKNLGFERTSFRIEKDIKELKQKIFKEFSKKLVNKVVCKDISNTIIKFL